MLIAPSLTKDIIALRGCRLNSADAVSQVGNSLILVRAISPQLPQKLLRLGVYPYLSPDAIFISDQIGIGKPNPKIYLKARINEAPFASVLHGKFQRPRPSV